MGGKFEKKQFSSTYLYTNHKICSLYFTEDSLPSILKETAHITS